MNDACCATPKGNDDRTFDLTVLGAGSAGFSAAIRATELGARVALVGQGTIGGTCVNVGCVPSKTMIRAAEALHNGAALSRFDGLAGEARVADWSALVAQKDELVAGLRQAKYLDMLEAYPSIAYVNGGGSLAGDQVAVNGAHLTTSNILIATGASPALPDIAGLDTVPYLTSTTALELTALPRSLLVIGGGYVGCELAQLFARAGVAVTILCRSRLLPAAEPEISEALAGYFRDEGITVEDGLAYRQIEQTGYGVALHAEVEGAPKISSAERVLVTTGRTPNTQGLALEEAAIDLTAGGGIAVDQWMRTSRQRVYAAGDVTGRDMYVYMAAYGAKLAAENALLGNVAEYDPTAMPAVVFTDPQAASVGLTEAGARARGFEVDISVLPLEYVPRALAARDTRGLIKLVAERETGRLLGAHILAPEGGDSIQTAALAIKAGLTVEALGSMIFPYLTTVEGLKLAAQAFHKDVAKLSCCAG